MAPWTLESLGKEMVSSLSLLEMARPPVRLESRGKLMFVKSALSSKSKSAQVVKLGAEKLEM